MLGVVTLTFGVGFGTDRAMVHSFDWQLSEPIAAVGCRILCPCVPGVEMAWWVAARVNGFTCWLFF